MRGKLKVNNFIIDNSTASDIEGQTLDSRASIYFENVSELDTSSCFVGSNLNIELAVNSESIPKGYNFVNYGIGLYDSIPYKVPVGSKLLVVETYYEPETELWK